MREVSDEAERGSGVDSEYELSTDRVGGAESFSVRIGEAAGELDMGIVGLCPLLRQDDGLSDDAG